MVCLTAAGYAVGAGTPSISNDFIRPILVLSRRIVHACPAVRTIVDKAGTFPESKTATIYVSSLQRGRRDLWDYLAFDASFDIVRTLCVSWVGYLEFWWSRM